ncbi:MAG: hypothetical protein PVJ08_07180 [Dehalococcoidia bacterium]|jgi:hypothetical protein
MMTTKRKLLLILIVLVGIAIAFVAVPLSTIAAIVVWIFLLWNIRKKGIGLFHEQMEPDLVARRYRLMKITLIVAAISFIGGITGAVFYNVLYAVAEEEDAVTFIIALSTLWLFILSTGGGLAIYLTGQRNPKQ